jgi:ribonuclease E
MLEAGQAMAVTPKTTGDVVPGSDESTQASQGQNSPRERRSRDRYGRDRRERGERSGSQGQNSESQDALETAEADNRVQAVAPAPELAAPVVTSGAKASTTASANTSGRKLPRVQAYKLPLGSLNEVASAAGLQWVNSDADKVAAVQATIAAEPKPVHVPRERPAPVVLDEGPLILVETRKDLSALKLPFEQQ